MCIVSLGRSYVKDVVCNCCALDPARLTQPLSTDRSEGQGGGGALAWPPPSAVPAVSLAAPHPPRFPLRVSPPPTMDSDEEHDVTTVAEQKQLRSELATALAAFDRAEDWADLIHDLQRVNRVLSKHARATSLPHKELLAKRLSQCLNASLPSGTLRVRGRGPSHGRSTRGAVTSRGGVPGCRHRYS